MDESPIIGARRRSRCDIYLSLAILIFSMALASWLIPGYVSDYTTGDQELSPRFFPYLIAFVLALLSLMLLYHALWPKINQPVKDKSRLIDPSSLICIAVFIVCQQLISIIGLIPASFLTLMILMFLYGFRNWLMLGAFSAVLIITLSVFFEKVAQVPLPKGTIFEWLF